jgi:hypothetical protein
MLLQNSAPFSHFCARGTSASPVGSSAPQAAYYGVTDKKHWRWTGIGFHEDRNESGVWIQLVLNIIHHFYILY